MTAPQSSSPGSDWPPKFELMKLEVQSPMGKWIPIFASQLEWMAKDGHPVRAIEAPVEAARTPHPAARGELAEMVYEAVRFANFAAGEGFCPAPDCMEAKDPAAFLSDFCKFNETDDYEAIADLARDAILTAAQPKLEPRLTDNDDGEISVTIGGKEVRGWSYKDDAERRAKMFAAREYVEGWHDGRQA